MIFSPFQVILSTNIAESSVTVPDVKYGASYFFLLCCAPGWFFFLTQSLVFVLFCQHSDWLLPGPSHGVWPRNQLSVSASHLGIQNELQPAQRWSNYSTEIKLQSDCIHFWPALTYLIMSIREGRSIVKGLLLPSCHQGVLEKWNPGLHGPWDAGKIMV